MEPMPAQSNVFLILWGVVNECALQEERRDYWGANLYDAIGRIHMPGSSLLYLEQAECWTAKTYDINYNQWEEKSQPPGICCPGTLMLEPIQPLKWKGTLCGCGGMIGEEVYEKEDG